MYARRLGTALVVVSLASIGYAQPAEGDDASREGGLRARWRFDEGNGSMAQDCFGGFDGTLYTGTEWSPGVSGSALEFVDHGMVWQIPEAFDDTVLTTQALTAAVWLYRYGDVPEQSGVIFDARAQGADAGFELTMSADGHLTFFTIWGYHQIQRIDSVSAVAAGQWAHVVAEFDYAAGALRLFIDGQEDAASPAPVTEPYFDDYSNAAIGNNHWAPGDGQWGPFHGVIDEVRFYDRALTVDEVFQLHRAYVDYGDMNCDGTMEFGDINPFVLRLSNPAEYHEQYPDCPDANGDINDDGVVDFGDINPFIALLTGGG